MKTEESWSRGMGIVDRMNKAAQEYERAQDQFQDWCRNQPPSSPFWDWSDFEWFKPMKTRILTFSRKPFRSIKIYTHE